jgi:dimethylaniline monooxygenase (N-oxide forming)
MPLAAAQSEWVCDYLAGRYALPAQGAMRADMDEERREMFARYVPSKRHTMQVDYDDYLAALDRERKRGAVRARRHGRRLPVPARAERLSHEGVGA